jgi:hypothetical protein
MGKLAEAIVAKVNERDVEVLLANLKAAMETPTASGANPSVR